MVDLVQEAWKEHTCLAFIASHCATSLPDHQNLLWEQISTSQIRCWSSLIDIVIVNGLTQTANSWGSVDQWLKMVDPLQWAWKPR
eukprot:9890509-Ditylum_brightwellii.AAC.1